MDHERRDQDGPGQPSRIRHTAPGIGGGGGFGSRGAGDDDAPPEVPVAAGPPTGLGRGISPIERKAKHEESWSRTPNTTGAGAIHVKTFNCKLTEDALRYMDQHINEWLDAHPQYEVKFVTSTVGILTGKLKEPHLICQVWV